MTANLQLDVLIQFPDDVKWQFSTLRRWLLYESDLYQIFSPVHPLPAEGTVRIHKGFNIQIFVNPRLAPLSILNKFSDFPIPCRGFVVLHRGNSSCRWVVVISPLQMVGMEEDRGYFGNGRNSKVQTFNFCKLLVGHQRAWQMSRNISGGEADLPKLWGSSSSLEFQPWGKGTLHRSYVNF